MGFGRFFKGLDADRVFSYKTVRVVKILDRRLGILHYSVLPLNLFIHCVLYNCVREKIPAVGKARRFCEDVPYETETSSPFERSSLLSPDRI